MKLKHCRWLTETNSLNTTAIASAYNSITKEFPEYIKIFHFLRWDKASYFMGSFINSVYEHDKEKLKLNYSESA